MIRDFSKEELIPGQSETDTELTLGGRALLGLGGGLLLLCAISFGLGYMVGHRRPADEKAAAVAPVPASRRAATGSKPGAGEQAPPRARTQAATNTPDDDGERPAPPPTPPSSQSSTVAAQPQARPAPGPQVRPALGVQAGGAQPSPAFQVQPAMKQPQGWMVQIAQVSHPEDAEVLVNALRKRGYAVMARRDLSDSLIHVQTGPFVNRNDANAMRQKLLNDGYNAIVQ